MRQLHFGGSFDPIHFGHLITARAVAENAGFDRVTLVPSHVGPHKQGRHAADVHHRLAMCRLAIDGDPLFEVDPIEADRPGPSYAIDTADELYHRGATAVYWLIGGDVVATLPTWHHADRLLQKVTFIVMARPGWLLDPLALPIKIQPLAQNVVAVPQIDISSTLIRQRMAAGQSIRNFTPQAIVEYIQHYRLYE